MNLSISDTVIAVVGLGYVGLPLAVEFGRKYNTVGFDIDSTRVQELKRGVDRTLECTSEEIDASLSLRFSSSIDALAECNVYIVTVPTPIDKQNQPDLTPLIKASKMLGRLIGVGDVVIYESTVYPGATEEVCVPILQKESKLEINNGFFVGYSPERINPGDRSHRLTDILKITSGSNDETAEFVDQLYGEIIRAGTHRASSIKVAEAAKVIENTQRDVNIALVNELSIIFSKLSIDTEEVLEAAGTKWNFLPFRPGLVGGHCIGVDPYYLTHKAISVGYNPEIILSGRRLNDDMPKHVVSAFIKQLLMKSIHVVGSNVLILGLAFKENCPDIRNTKIVDVMNELQEYNVEIDVYDPYVDAAVAKHEYGISLLPEKPSRKKYDGILLLVAHNEFRKLSADDLRALCKPNSVIYDLKYVLNKCESDVRP